MSSATATGINDPDVETCVASIIKAIEFPKPKSAADVTVAYPFQFAPPTPAAKK